MAGGSHRPPMMRVRINEDYDAELYCHGCHDWLPITVEFWPSKTSFWRCRACNNERARLYQARKAIDPEARMKNIRKSRAYREYLRANPELIAVDNALWREEMALKQRLVYQAPGVAEKRRGQKADYRRRQKAKVA